MGKDGTYRGQGHFKGQKSKTTKYNPSDIDSLKDLGTDLPEPDDFDGYYENIPDVSPYLLEEQHKDYTELCAQKVFNDTYKWLQKIGCEEVVSKQLIEQYAMSVARWIQCERALSKHGFLAKHPTTGLATTSPFVTMSREYKKQVNSDWYQIYIIARDNGIETDNDDEMEDLLD